MTTANKLHALYIPGNDGGERVFAHETESVVQSLAMKHRTRYVTVALQSAREYPCAECGAVVGAPCSKKNGEPSRAHHSARVSDARSVAYEAARAELSRTGE